MSSFRFSLHKKIIILKYLCSLIQAAHTMIPGNSPTHPGLPLSHEDHTLHACPYLCTQSQKQVAGTVDQSTDPHIHSGTQEARAVEYISPGSGMAAGSHKRPSLHDPGKIHQKNQERTHICKKKVNVILLYHLYRSILVL